MANSSFWPIDRWRQDLPHRVPWGGDTHDIWIDPTNANRILVTHDGGMIHDQRSRQDLHRVTLPIGQMYHVAVDNDVPYHIYSNMQDDGTMRGLSTIAGAGPTCPGRAAGGGTRRAAAVAAEAGAGGQWDHGLGGCESGFTLPDLTDTEHHLGLAATATK